MDTEKAEFLDVIDNPDVDADDIDGPVRGVIWDRVRTQIADDDPPQVWHTARRLRQAGLVHSDVLRQLAMALISTLGTASSEQVLDHDAYVRALDRLPLPPSERVTQVLVDLVRDRQPVAAEEVDRRAAEQLGMAPDDPLADMLLDRVHQQLLDDGVLVLLTPDVLVHLPSLTVGTVLTHRLTEAERDAGVLDGADLPALDQHGLQWQGQEVVADLDADGPLRVFGPQGWLAGLRPGLVAIRLGADGEVTLSNVDSEPEFSEQLVTALRAVYDAELEEPWLPVAGMELLLGVLARDRDAFTEAALPLTELAAAAGLERRAGYYAHDEDVWLHEQTVRRDFRLLRSLDTGPGLDAARAFFTALESGKPDTAAAREMLRGLNDPEVLDVTETELLDADDPAPLTALAGRLVAAASRPSEQAVAHWVAALTDERRGAVLDAEAHLRAAVHADPGWPYAEDRLAWYESDRGDAAAAVDRWRGLGFTADTHQDLATIAPFAATAKPPPKLGRNQPCWCGSGRKYKTCHLGTPERAPLPERVDWLWRKAMAYLERAGTEARTDVGRHATARASDLEDDDAVQEALTDPLLFDTVLHSGGWFDRFLAERGPLLPDDEAMLASTWNLSERSVFEMLETAPGRGVTVRDLRTGDRTEIRERTFSRHATVGELVCARVVPDGQTHQFVGGVFRVPPGREKELLGLLDGHDGLELLRYVNLLHRPPSLVSTAGDPLVDCLAELEVADPAGARAELDLRYDPDDEGWTWFGTTDERGEHPVLGWLRLTDDVLTIRTMSESRLDSVLTELRAVLTEARVRRDERNPFEPGDAPRPTADPTEIPSDALDELADRFERRWCDERIPALDDYTPREAAADPTRREEVERLIASFPEIDPTGGAFGLRPARLRELLGLGG